MEHLYIPKDYQSELSLYDTQVAIKTVKDFFQQSLAEQLYLLRVSAPLFVTPESGLNDNLNGVERPVTFGIKEQEERPVEIVHSLARNAASTGPSPAQTPCRFSPSFSRIKFAMAAVMFPQVIT